MKITFVNYSFVGEIDHFKSDGKPIGGGEVYLTDLCHALEKKGFECAILQGGVRNSQFAYQGIPVRQIKSRGRYWFNFEWPGAITPADGYVHLHDANHAYPLARGNSATFHGMSWDLPYAGNNIIDYVNWKARYYFFKTLIRHAIKHCSSIVSVDTGLLRYVQSEHPNRRDKITVIPNYVDLEKFTPKTSSKNGKGDKFTFLFPRSFTKPRGTLLLLEALRSIPDDDFEVWAVGTGPLRPLLEAAAAKDSRIKLLGHKDHYAQMPAIYNSCDAVLIPSLGVEGTSLSCLEGMAYGKPVVASNVGGLIDIIEDKRDGILIKPAPGDLAQAMLSLKDNPKECARLGKNARVRAEEFSQEAWAAKWCKYAEANFKA